MTEQLQQTKDMAESFLTDQLMKHALDETLVKLSHQLEQAFGLNEEGVTVDDIEITVACILALTKRLLKKPEIIEVED